MITIGNYVKPKTLEDAYDLNQVRGSRVMGGMMWMRLGNARVKTVIDLSDLGLDHIEDEGNVIKIGAMCTLRQVEECEALRELYGDGIAESIRHPVPQSGDDRRKYLRKVRIFRCADSVSRSGYLCGTLRRRDRPSVRVCQPQA